MKKKGDSHKAWHSHRRSQAFLLSDFLLALFFLAFCVSVMKTEAAPMNRLFIGLEEEFTLHKGETAELKGACLEIEIKRFFNQPCPPNVQCVWSGVGIEFEYRCDKKVQKGINLVKVFGGFKVYLHICGKLPKWRILPQTSPISYTSAPYLNSHIPQASTAYDELYCQ